MAIATLINQSSISRSIFVFLLAYFPTSILPSALIYSQEMKISRSLVGYRSDLPPQERIVFENGQPVYILPDIYLLPSFDEDWYKLKYGELEIVRNMLYLRAEPGGGSSEPPKAFYYKIEANRAYVSIDGINYRPLKLEILKRKGRAFCKSQKIYYFRWYQIRIRSEFFDGVFELADGGFGDDHGH